MVWSAAALATGFALDAIFGDPYNFPHIVRLIGSLIAALEKFLRRTFPATERGEKAAGVLLVLAVGLICTAIPFVILFYCYRFRHPMGYVIESFLCWQLLAAKSLETESMKVFHSLKEGDMEGARRNVSMIVGRDTEVLNESGITRAAVETVAENTSDGVAAPLLYITLGGAALGCLYKAVNTMDSMVGYKNEQYLHFGRFAAKADDCLSYIPSRVCALLMIAAAYLLRFDGKNAFRIWRRDRRKHLSPNAAQTESVCAGALGVLLAGPISYFGQMRDKPTIGDDTRPIKPKDIEGANRLMVATSVLTLIISLLFRAVCLGVALYGWV
jgi:adenosylcobinamide-phosphate synthase